MVVIEKHTKRHITWFCDDVKLSKLNLLQNLFSNMKEQFINFNFTLCLVRNLLHATRHRIWIDQHWIIEVFSVVLREKTESSLRNSSIRNVRKLFEHDCCKGQEGYRQSSRADQICWFPIMKCSPVFLSTKNKKIFLKNPRYRL